MIRHTVADADAEFLVEDVNPLTEQHIVLAGELDASRPIVVEKIKAGVELPDNFFLRLNLDFIDYGRLERLCELGVENLRSRHETLAKLVEEIRAGKQKPPAPLNADDIRMAAIRAGDLVREAETIMKKVIRPRRTD